MVIEQHNKLSDIFIIRPDVFQDYRGDYIEIYNKELYNQKFQNISFVRDCISISNKNVLRGIHYDNKTWKLIQCMYGKIYFIVVDMREESDDYLKWESFILSDENRIQVLVPPRFGNGHLVLSDECIFHYKMTEYYDSKNEKVLKWDDPKVNICWPIKNPILSIKDKTAQYIK